MNGEPPGVTHARHSLSAQRKVVHLTNDLSSDLFIGYGSVQLHALYLGTADAARAVLAASNLLQTVGQPLSANYEQMSYIDSMVQFGNQAEVRIQQVSFGGE